MTSWRKRHQSRVSEDVFRHLVCAKQAFPRLVGEKPSQMEEPGESCQSLSRVCAKAIDMSCCGSRQIVLSCWLCS